ncbi:Hypp1057 [Branchiostoma lanceolatum]|uniref:Hypp1057 protein n=1 Tax=Branchiostoma lanceolatum TaxID=7740 RepID=A0A8K0ELE0_BRALA|nr:Hypp1057 [Branchiostoma lanceolatum]
MLYLLQPKVAGKAQRSRGDAAQLLAELLMVVNPTTLLQTEEPAFKFISKERFQQTKYDNEICSAIVQVATTYQSEVTRLLRMFLPKLATGFQKQKGDIFGFGEHDAAAQYSVTQMDKEKLEKAPIHNLDAERSVGFVNYELSRRGAKQLKVASAAQVKAKSSDLIERREPGSFRNYSKEARKGGRIPEILLAWEKKQEELKKQGLKDKEIANVAVDRRRNKDLQTLKNMGGPFTTAAEVNTYVAATDADDTTKLGRLYLEVRYARDTALSLPKISDIFRLLKSYKKLPLDAYAINLKLYLNNITSNADVTLQ